MNTKPVFLGFTSNIDYEISLSSQEIIQMIKDYNIKQSDLVDYKKICNIKDLISFTLYCIQNNIGTERYIFNASTLSSFAELFEYSVTLGGTAARAAVAMSKIGYSKQLYLHLTACNGIIRKLLHPDLSYISSKKDTVIYPHVIIQYSSDIEVNINNIHISPLYSNRLIYTNDIDNSIVEINKKYMASIYMSKVTLFSGFNAMTDINLFEKRIYYIKKIFSNMVLKPFIFYESANFYINDLSTILQNEIGDIIDIYSLNEDEFSLYFNSSIDLLIPELVFHYLKMFKNNIFNAKYLLLHTKYWALIYGRNSNRFVNCLYSAIILASTRGLYGNNYDMNSFYDVQKMNRDIKAIEFSKKIEIISNKEVTCVPSIDILNKNLTTVGLGDAFVGGFLTGLL